MVDKTAQELERMKKKVDEAKTKVSNLEGKRDSLLEQLKNDFGLDTVEQAEKKLKELEQQKEELEQQVEEKLQEIKENYDL
jgi:flagellar biosynthesis chaperone FliJ